jgi:hypothetical protein
MDATILVAKSSVVKACVILDQTLALYYYSGNYSKSKMLLSRFQWPRDGFNLAFSDFTVKEIYQTIVSFGPPKVSPIERWEKAIGISIEAGWPSMMKYVHDPILNNETKENFYETHTRAFPVARKFKNNNKIDCAFCGTLEDELHCFVKCIKVLRVWESIKRVLLRACPWLFTEIDILFGYPLQALGNRYKYGVSSMRKQFGLFGIQDAANFLLMRKCA